jgi:hypothetical protein
MTKAIREAYLRLNVSHNVSHECVYQKGTISKERTGYVFSRGETWVARVTYTDSTGTRRNISRSFPTKSEANKGFKTLVKDLKDAIRHKHIFADNRCPYLIATNQSIEKAKL